MIRHIYMVSPIEAGYEKVKIGVSINPAQRIQALQNGHPETLCFLMCVCVRRADEIEKDLHQLFKDYRLKGEWFDLSSREAQDRIHLLKNLLWAADLDDGCYVCTGKWNQNRIKERLEL